MTYPHGAVRYNYLKCRCDVCRVAWTAYNRELRRKRIEAGCKPRKHGITGYQAYACRCQVCTAANRLANRRAYQRRKKRQAGG